MILYFTPIRPSSRYSHDWTWLNCASTFWLVSIVMNSWLGGSNCVKKH